jgi:protein ImuB
MKFSQQDKRYISIWFPHLAIDWFELHQPQLKKTAFVLVVPSHGRKVITASNSLAIKNGIEEGMVLADARAILPSLQYFDEKPSLIPRLLKKISGWCIRFTPYAAVDPPAGIILDATGCSHLWGGDEYYLKDMLDRLERKGFHAMATIADTIGCAWATARFGKEIVVEKQKHADTLLSLPPESLRIEANTVERLHKLGLKRIEKLISIPQSSLRRRFGKLIVQRLNQAFGIDQESIQPVCPIEPYQERLPCMEPIVTAGAIEIALQQLLETMCNRLAKEGKGIRTASFKGYRIDNRIVNIEISTSRASNNINHLFHLFELKFSTFEPGLGIELFVLEATKVEDHLPIQSECWKQATGLNNNALSELVDRISSRVGAESIHRYLPDEHYWPERSFKAATSLADQSATEWRIDRRRPLQLLSTPECIQVTAPIPDYPPMLFRYKGKLHKVKKADGPERIEQEWWIEDGEHRDYYSVEDDEGCRYWLFRSGHYDEEKNTQWFIHGFFP